MMVLWIVLGLLVFAGLGLISYFISVYNGLIMLSRNIDKAWANIDVLLKQRHDEIPKLVKVCEGYMQYERETLERITKARTACMSAKGPGQSAQAENMLAGALKSLFAVAEQYPDLKANQNFMQLQNRVTDLENQIADRRELFNDSANNYNIRIHQIPDMFVAGILNMKEKELFKVSQEDREDVSIDFKMPK
jgi:LemA protein